MIAIRELNCGSMCPLGGKHLLGSNVNMICRCWLIETNAGLVLVDTGFSTRVLAQAGQTLSRALKFMARPALNPDEDAIFQITKWGYKPSDIRHIVLTHLDADHAGGIADFPQARIHLLQDELNAGSQPRHWIEKLRYHSALWQHRPLWQTYKEGGKWKGLDAVTQLDGLPPEILLVPLRGHTRGHTGVAVETQAGWRLHAGDAYFSTQELRDATLAPPGLEFFQTLIASENHLRLKNRQRLRDLHKSGQVKVDCSHAV